MVAASGTVAFPLAGGSTLSAGVLLALGMFLFSFGQTVVGVHANSLRQTLVPNRLVGRVMGTCRFPSWRMRPIGALVCGAIGEAFGLRVALAAGVCGLCAVVAVIACSPLRSLRGHPAAEPDGPVETSTTIPVSAPVGARARQ